MLLPALKAEEEAQMREHLSRIGGKMDDVLDCIRLLHYSRNTHGYRSFLEIDEYITQARDKSYETMMRVGKRGLNLAANAAVTAAAKGQGVLSEKLRSFSMQDLTLIRDEDGVHLRSPEPRRHPSGGGLLETIDDSASCYSSGEEASIAQRSNGIQSDARTDPSDDDAGDKMPKRTQSLKAPKKVTKTEPPLKSIKARPKKKADSPVTLKGHSPKKGAEIHMTGKRGSKQRLQESQSTGQESLQITKPLRTNFSKTLRGTEW
ncbi:receptor expression-enhancing protein 2 isoform B [Alligator mississippiensis]|uniref:Receptor expression-enhancing protein 2 isoform B n=1 Tax=Alligator mississippiensis TaxID=8496 RepID=A0A151MHZ5_ALLMI|nr:receptor expression-enhancing protein 2 isoform B [Alligator mississippiensis]